MLCWWMNLFQNHCLIAEISYSAKFSTMLLLLQNSGEGGEATTTHMLLGTWSEKDSAGHKILETLGFNDERASELAKTVTFHPLPCLSNKFYLIMALFEVFSLPSGQQRRYRELQVDTSSKPLPSAQSDTWIAVLLDHLAISQDIFFIELNCPYMSQVLDCMVAVSFT